MTISIQKLHNNWKAYTLKNDNGMTVRLMNYGGIITDIIVPDKFGRMENVVLGYQNDQDYEADPHFFGAIIGRVAGRIDNASYYYSGKNYSLEQNEGSHHLHGGSSGFHSVIWETEPFENDRDLGVKLKYTSLECTGGYPGTDYHFKKVYPQSILVFALKHKVFPPLYTIRDFQKLCYILVKRITTKRFIILTLSNKILICQPLILQI